MRSATTGLRLCGIADEPFWPAPNGSCTSATSVRARCRISSANLSSDEATIASAVSSSACRSRCEDLRRGRRRLETEALAGDPLELRVGCGVGADRAGELADAHPLERARDASRPRSSSNAQPASFRPKVVGSACTPCVRPICSVARCSSARATTTASARSSPARISAPASRICSGERGVDDVGRGEPVVEPAALLAELLGDGVDERGGVVVERRLELGDALGVGGTAPARSRAAARRARLRARPRPPCAASSTSSQARSLPSSDQILAMAGRE